MNVQIFRKGIAYMQIYFSLQLLTLNVNLQIGKVALRVHLSQFGNP